MKKAIKTTGAFLAAGILAVSLAACSQPANSNASNANSSKSATTTSNTSSNANKNTSNTSTNTSRSSKSATPQVITEVEADDPYAIGQHHAVVSVEGYDPITITLDADAAPVTVSNFCRLANSGFYDGLTFYRFVDKFCMQGGSSNNSAAIVDDGNPNIVGEFSSNKKENPLADAFKKGTVAMARSSDPNSAATTFFVTLDSSNEVSQSLNGKYAAFGTIDEDGMAVVDQIVSDYLKNVDDPSSGSITKQDKQAKITSIKIQD